MRVLFVIKDKYCNSAKSKLKKLYIFYTIFDIKLNKLYSLFCRYEAFNIFPTKEVVTLALSQAMCNSLKN